MGRDPTSWDPPAVIAALRRQAQTSPDGTVSVQVFLTQAVAPDAVADCARHIVGGACDAIGAREGRAQVGRVSRIARSFTLQAAPSLIERVIGDERVSAVLPSQIDDIRPKPIDA
ncbi:hypothetical protein [Salinarimonas sp.]|uniref:hypothetical protein n=1 Tax=Salinarimonas sp. TaxID=2766526 RepID=UPI00391C30A0